MSATTDRAVAVMKMHLVDRVTLFVMPLAIVASSFVINLLVWSLVPTDGRSTGGAASLHAFVLVAAMFAVTRGLPFALGMGASRRAFMLGTATTGVVIAVIMGTLYLVLQQVERATDGWWLHGHFFDFPWLADSNPVLRWLLLVVSVAVTWALGTLLSAIWARWGTPGLVVGGPLAILVVGGAVVLVSWQGWWHVVGGWFADLTPATTTAWSTALTLALMAATWVTLRRVRATS